MGELNGSAAAAVGATIGEYSNGGGSTSGGVSFGDNDIRTFETDSSERKNEYASSHDDADDEDSNDRLQIGDDIHLDTLDIHSLNMGMGQNINAPPLLDGIEVL